MCVLKRERGGRETERERDREDGLASECASESVCPFQVYSSLFVCLSACGRARKCVCHRRLTELMRELVIAFCAAQTAREPYEVTGRRVRKEMQNNVVCINLVKRQRLQHFCFNVSGDAERII